MTRFAGLVARDVRLALRSGGAAQPAVFFALSILIFALAVGPDRARLADLAAPALWASATLAALMSLERLFQADFEDGSLETIAETVSPLLVAMLAKATAHWLTTGLPLLLATPALGLLLNLPADRFGPLALSLAIGTPALSLIGMAGAALTVALRRASLLIAVLAAPSYAPVLIFGVGAAADGAGSPAMLLLAATGLIALLVGPLAAAAAIRLNLE